MLQKLSLFLIVVLCTVLSQSPVMAQDSFRPIMDENHWAYAAVTNLMMKGVLDGYPDGTFRGKRAMTRYELATALERLSSRCRIIIDPPPVAEIEDQTRPKYTPQEKEAILLKAAPNFYAPVPTENWAYAAMRALQEAGIHEQFGLKSSFDGTKELKRSAFAGMLLLIRENVLAKIPGGGYPSTTVQDLLLKLEQEFQVEMSALKQVQ